MTYHGVPWYHGRRAWTGKKPVRWRTPACCSYYVSYFEGIVFACSNFDILLYIWHLLAECRKSVSRVAETWLTYQVEEQRVQMMQSENQLGSLRSAARMSGHFAAHRQKASCPGGEQLLYHTRNENGSSRQARTRGTQTV